MKPKSVAQIEYQDRTNDRKLRQPVVLGLRDDKDPLECRLPENPMAASAEFPIRVSHPDKVLWPAEGYTKRDLIAFYDRVFSRLAPFLRDRLLTLERCPDGLNGDCFFQKEKPAGLPEGTPSRRILHTKGLTNYVVGGRKETQLALANLGCLAVHVWSSRVRAPRKPDWICFDLDPASGRFSDAIVAALIVREALDALKLVSFPKTSGGKGIHIFVPIRTGPDADAVLAFAKRLGERLSSAYPQTLTMETRIRDRGNRVYLDPFRNAFGQTVVAPFSVRRRPGAPVSTPLKWTEVKAGLDPATFTLGNFGTQLRRKDPWEGFFGARQPIAAAFKALDRL